MVTGRRTYEEASVSFSAISSSFFLSNLIVMPPLQKPDIIPCIIEEDGISPEQRKSWARLIQKIYEVDSFTCLA